MKFKPNHFFWKALWLDKFEYSILSSEFCLTQEIDTIARQNHLLSPPEMGFGQHLVSAPNQDEIFWPLGAKYRPHKSDGDQTTELLRGRNNFMCYGAFPGFVHLKVKKYLPTSVFSAPVRGKTISSTHLSNNLHSQILHDWLSKWMLQITP